MDELKVLQDIDTAISQIEDKETQSLIIDWVYEKYGTPEDVEAVEKQAISNGKGQLKQQLF